MTDCSCHATATACATSSDRTLRRVLWIVMALNAALFVAEFSVGLWAHSSALMADSLDALGDAGIYLLTLVVMTGSVRARAGASLLKGALQGAFGLFVIVEVVRRAISGETPDAGLMTVMSLVALTVNVTAFALLTRFRNEDLNLRSVWLCSRNDLANNLGVLAAAGLVAWTGTRWPDLVVGLLVATLFLQTSFTVLRAAWREWSTGIPTPMDDGHGHAAPSIPKDVRP
jgi:cation diffusion facilitator family transporter